MISIEDIPTPIYLYLKNKKIRPELIKRNIIREDTYLGENRLYIPSILCEIWDPKNEKSGIRKRIEFPFPHQKFYFLLLESLGDIHFAFQNFDLMDSYTFPNGRIYTPIL